MPFQPGTPRRARRPRPLAEHHHSAPIDSSGIGEQDGALLYTPQQAAALLQVRESWLRKKAAARAIPCTFLGKHLRFSPADLTAIVAAAAQPPTRRLLGRPRSASRDPDLMRSRIRSVHPPDRNDHNHTDGSSPWPG
jgi:excisionase family DNA binding protein